MVLDLSYLKRKDDDNNKKVIGMESKCWSCNAIWNISLLPPNAKEVKCKCGGYVVTPSGKAMTRPIYEGQKVDSPLLEVDDETKEGE